MVPPMKDKPAFKVCPRCQEEFRRPSYLETYCPACKRAMQNEHYRLNTEKRNIGNRVSYWKHRETNRKYAQAYRAKPGYKERTRARRKVLTEISAGRLERGNCEQCGADNAQAHHKDYAKPLEIIWLCRSCHTRLHAIEKRSARCR